MRLIHLRKLNQSGDTIVEVLIVLAVLSLAFSMSYATANKSLARSQIANEHSHALGLINKQVELTRAAYAKGGDFSSISTTFCIPSAANPLVTAVSSTCDTCIASSAAIATCPDAHYRVVVKHYDAVGGNPEYLRYTVNWPGTGTSGTQYESLTYRISKQVNSDATIAYLDNSPVPDGGCTVDCAPPADKIFTRTIYGDNVNPPEGSCTDGAPIVSFSQFKGCNDGADLGGPTKSIVAFRNVNMKFSNTFGDANAPNPGPGTITFVYRQGSRFDYQEPALKTNLLPPPNYSYRLNIQIFSGANKGTATVVDLPIPSDKTSYRKNGFTSNPITVDIPHNDGSNKFDIHIDWINNPAPYVTENYTNPKTDGVIAGTTNPFPIFGLNKMTFTNKPSP